MKALHTVEKTLVLERTPFLASRLLNHSRFPDGRKYRRSVRCRAQPLYLLTEKDFGNLRQAERLYQSAL
ncbi:MAG: hypothetical protein ACLUO8_09180, partial [Christensenellales bacterium]